MRIAINDRFSLTEIRPTDIQAFVERYVDVDGYIWIKDAAHAGVPEHWDVQIAGGRDYIRVDRDGNRI